MGGLRGGRGGGGGGGFEEESDSFEAMEDARSDKDGCELFLGGGGGGGDESVGCCVVASIFILWRFVPRLAMSYVTAVRASALYSCRHAAENLSAAQSAEDGVISAASLRPGRHTLFVLRAPTLFRILRELACKTTSNFQREGSACRLGQYGCPNSRVGLGQPTRSQGHAIDACVSGNTIGQ